jgi:hypothetical protein
MNRNQRRTRQETPTPLPSRGPSPANGGCLLMYVFTYIYIYMYVSHLRGGRHRNQNASASALEKEVWAGSRLHREPNLHLLRPLLAEVHERLARVLRGLCYCRAHTSVHTHEHRDKLVRRQSVPPKTSRVQSNHLAARKWTPTTAVRQQKQTSFRQVHRNTTPQGMHTILHIHPIHLCMYTSADPSINSFI